MNNKRITRMEMRETPGYVAGLLEEGWSEGVSE